MPIGTSTKPPWRILPAKRKHFRALALFRPERGERRRAMAENPGQVGQGLDVVDDRRASPKDLFCAGNGGRIRGHARVRLR